MKLLILALCPISLQMSSLAIASENYPNIFITHEQNNNSSINSVGAGMNFRDHNTHLGGAFTMALGHANIMTKTGINEKYLAWELGGKIGYFSDISLYLEAGLDLGELIGRGHLDEDNHHDHTHITIDDDHIHTDEYHHDHRYIKDSLDAYVGIGGGFDLKHLQIRGQVRYRQIDSKDWEALDTVYSGITLSFAF